MEHFVVMVSKEYGYFNTLTKVLVHNDLWFFVVPHSQTLLTKSLQVCEAPLLPHMIFSYLAYTGNSVIVIKNIFHLLIATPFSLPVPPNLWSFKVICSLPDDLRGSRTIAQWSEQTSFGEAVSQKSHFRLQMVFFLFVYALVWELKPEVLT